MSVPDFSKSLFYVFLNIEQYPDTADFGALDWKIGRSDEKYQILGKVTAKNGFGVKDDILFSVWFVANGTEYTVEGISLNGVRVK